MTRFPHRFAWAPLALALSCASLPKSLQPDKPSAQLDKVELAKLTFKDMDLDFLVSVENPYPLGLRVARVQAKFSVEGNQVFAVDTENELVLAANQSSPVPFLVNLKFADLINVVRDYAAKDSLDSEIQLIVTVNLHNGTLPGVPRTWDFPFTLHKTLPTIKPKVHISDFKIEGPSAQQIAAQLQAKAREMADQTIRNVSVDKVVSAFDDILRGKPRDAIKDVLPPNLDIRDLDLKFAIEFTLNLDNETPTALLFSNLNFKFHMNGEPLLDGSTTEVRREGNRSLAKIRGEFSVRSLSDGLIKAFKTRQASFHIEGETKVKLPDIIRVEPVTLAFSDDGDFSL
jgi:hypothetical protein